jgi:hypothetical protein
MMRIKSDGARGTPPESRKKREYFQGGVDDCRQRRERRMEPQWGFNKGGQG